MIKFHRRSLTLLVAFLALTFGLTFVVWSSSANQTLNQKEGSKPDVTPENDLPVLDLKQEAMTAADQQKARKHRLSLRQDWKITELRPRLIQYQLQRMLCSDCLRYRRSKAMRLFVAQSLIGGQS